MLHRSCIQLYSKGLWFHARHSRYSVRSQRSLATMSAQDITFEVTHEEIVHKRYLTLYNQRVKFSGPGYKSEEFEYDVMGHPRCDFKFVTVLPFHPSKDGVPASVTLVREYAQGPNALAYGLPSGGFDPSKHSDMEAAARAELSEEVSLRGGRFVRLIPEASTGILEAKWCRNRCTPWLVIDPEADPAPGARDAEEATLRAVRVPLAELPALMLGGEMLMPSVATIELGLRWLRQQGMISLDA